MREVYDEITVHYGEEHDYLGMTLIYKPEQKTILLTIKDYVNDVLDQIKQNNEDEMIKTVKTLASENLFKTRKKSDDNSINISQDNFILQWQNFISRKTRKVRYIACCVIFDYKGKITRS